MVRAASELELMDRALRAPMPCVLRFSSVWIRGLPPAVPEELRDTVSMRTPSPTPFSIRGRFTQGNECLVDIEVAPAQLDRPRERPRSSSLKALIDTGANTSAIRGKVAADLGLTPFGEAASVSGIGLHEVPVLMAVVAIALRAESGKQVYRYRRIAIVDAMPEDRDFVIGMDLLSDGVLTVHGPKAEWRWTMHRKDDWLVRRKEGG